MSVNTKINTRDWQEEEWICLNPGPGAYMGERKPYEVHGMEVRANNYEHAVYVWGLRVSEQSGHDLHKCALCGARLSASVLIFKDGSGNYYPIGEDCGAYIESRGNRRDWKERRLMQEIKAVQTAKGARSVLKLPVESWYWDVPREERPAFVSLSKFRPYGAREEKWYVSIWGEDAGEVLRNWEDFQALRAQRHTIVEAAQTAKAAQLSARTASADEAKDALKAAAAVIVTDLAEQAREFASSVKNQDKSFPYEARCKKLREAMFTSNPYGALAQNAAKHPFSPEGQAFTFLTPRVLIEQAKRAVRENQLAALPENWQPAVGTKVRMKTNNFGQKTWATIDGKWTEGVKFGAGSIATVTDNGGSFYTILFDDAKDSDEGRYKYVDGIHHLQDIEVLSEVVAV